MARMARRGVRGEAALLLALLLLIEGLFGGLAIGARADTAAAFGVICSTDHQSDTAKPGRHGTALSDCCTLGCPMFGGGLPDTGALTLAIPSLPDALAATPAGTGASLARAELAPLHSRAPPAA